MDDEVKLFLDDEFGDDKHNFTVHIPNDQIDRMYKHIHSND